MMQLNSRNKSASTWFPIVSKRCTVNSQASVYKMTESGTPATKKLSSCPSRIYYTYISNDVLFAEVYLY